MVATAAGAPWGASATSLRCSGGSDAHQTHQLAAGCMVRRAAAASQLLQRGTGVGRRAPCRRQRWGLAAAFGGGAGDASGDSSRRQTLIK